MQKHVGIILVNFNTAKDTVECLESLEKCTHNNFSIYIVENASTDDSVKVITQWAKKKSKRFAFTDTNAQDFKSPKKSGLDNKIGKKNNLMLIHNENVGFSGATNLTSTVFTEGDFVDYILWLNCDTIVAPDFLELMVETMESDPKIGIVGPELHNADGSVEVGGRINYFLGKTPRHFVEPEEHLDMLLDVEMLIGACLLVRSEIVKNNAMFKDDYFVMYEDTYLCSVARKNGYRVVVDRRSVVEHKEGKSVKRFSNFRLYYVWRNSVWFVRERGPWYVQPVLFGYVWGRFILSIPVKLMKKNSAGIKVHFKALWEGYTVSRK